MARTDDMTIGAAAERPASRAADIGRAVMWSIAGWLPVLVVLVAWEVVARTALVTPFTLPSLSSVLQRIGTDAASGELMVNLAATIYRSLAGFVIAGALGIL